MFLVIVGLALYLIACAGWAKRLQSNGATIRIRQVWGLLAVVLVMAVPFLARGNFLNYAWSAIVACLGYVTIVYRPKWIVGNR